MDKKILYDAGINVDAGIKRFMDDREFYEEVLLQFLDDTSMSAAEAAYKADDHQALFDEVHGMKGVSGNLDITELYKCTCELTELLRQDEGTKEQIDASYARMQEAYKKATEGIRKAMKEQM